MLAIDITATTMAATFVGLLFSRKAQGWTNPTGAAVNAALALTLAWLALRTWGAFG